MAFLKILFSPYICMEFPLQKFGSSVQSRGKQDFRNAVTVALNVETS
jgi:hypothetical protein